MWGSRLRRGPATEEGPNREAAIGQASAREVTRGGEGDKGRIGDNGKRLTFLHSGELLRPQAVHTRPSCASFRRCIGEKGVSYINSSATASAPAPAPNGNTTAGNPIGQAGHGVTSKEESTYLALQATGLGDIFSIGEGGAPTQLDLVRGSRRGRLESVRLVVVMGARVL